MVKQDATVEPANPAAVAEKRRVVVACLTTEAIIRRKNGMRVEKFGGAKILRWSWEIEQGMRSAARDHLLKKFRIGEYHDSETANAIIHHQFTFFAERLTALVPKFTGRDALEFVLNQYEETTQILHGQGIADPNERERWLRIEGDFRRAMKYLAELICLQAPKSASKTSRRDSYRAMDQALLCAEMLVDMAEMSHRVHGVFPDHVVATIHASGGPIDWEVHIGGRYAGYDVALMARTERDRNHRKDFIEGHQFDIHTDRHAEVLDSAFESCFGWSYARFISGVCRIIDGCQPAPNGFPTLFIDRRKLIENFTDHGEPVAAVERMLAGFTVYPEKMRQEGRVVWNPKQEHRAYRRGFFEFPHETGLHLAFSREMARESLIHLVNGVCYKRLPEDWRHPQIDAALEALSRRAGLWFEDVVTKNLASLGVTGRRAKERVGLAAKAVIIPSEVGEIDFLGYEPKERLLVLAEAKMVSTGIEAKYWRDDVATFVGRKGSYVEKFRKKISWVTQQRRVLAVALGLPEDVRVAPVMLTLYPCIAKIFIDDFPCVSLTEFMLDYRTAAKWPYPLP
jgi:hypothetical protein